LRLFAVSLPACPLNVSPGRYALPCFRFLLFLLFRSGGLIMNLAVPGSHYPFVPPSLTGDFLSFASGACFCWKTPNPPGSIFRVPPPRLPPFYLELSKLYQPGSSPCQAAVPRSSPLVPKDWGQYQLGGLFQHTVRAPTHCSNVFVRAPLE